MNPFLAELYNTADNIGVSKTASDDTEKLAQAAILDQMLQNEGFDVEKLSAADLMKVATEIFGPNSAIVKSAGDMPPQFMQHEKSETPAEEKKEEEEKKEDEKKEAEKMASEMQKADFLGRQMAHAYVDELSKLEKQAGAQAAAPQQQATGPVASILGKMKAASAPAAQPTNGTTKQASALDVLAKQRAEEMLKQAGIAPAQDTPEARLEAAIQARAVEMLKEAGYQVG